MSQLFYRIIYSPRINFFIRHIVRLLKFMMPVSMQIPPSGIIGFKIGDNEIFLETNQTNYLTYLVDWNGALNFEYTPIFVELIKKTRSFVDIGANIGYYSILASIINPSIVVVSFEPAKGPLHFLLRNVQLNNLSNVKVEPIALSNKEGEIDFFEIRNRKYRYLKHNLAGDGNTGFVDQSRSFDVNTVKTTTFDGYFFANEIGEIDLVKIDTEGTENLIMEHARDHLLSDKPIVICETLFGQIEKELEDIFRHYGYEFYNHVGNGLVKVESIQRKVDNGVRNCFFVHPSKNDWIAKFVL
jgi:FkbM family methyltransferase